MALVTMLILAAHLNGLSRRDMPMSRRRIRTANGWLMMFLTIALACAAGVASTSDKRVFILSWMVVAGLTGLVLILAWIDAVNSLRLHRQDQARFRRTMRDLVAGRVTAGPDTGLSHAANPADQPRAGGC